MTTKTSSRNRPAGASRNWPVPAALLALSAVPLTGGTFRVVQVLGGPELIPADPRFDGSPLPIVLHVVGAALYVLVGVFQFVPRFRRRHPVWHRRGGRLLMVAGLLVAGSALWMTLFLPQQGGSGDLLYVVRLLVGAGMAACIVVGFHAIRRRDVLRHRAWMIRAYALGLGAGTQVLTQGFGQPVFGTGVIQNDLEMAAGWAINLAVAEWIIRRPARDRTRRRPAVPTEPQHAGALG